MRRRPVGLIVLATVLALGCGNAPPDGEAGAAADESAMDGSSATDGSSTALACRPQAPREEVAERVSAYDSTDISIAGEQARLCYSRPSARGRTMIGGDAVPYGELWRTGANEPTTLHLSTAADIAGIAVEPGSYSIYTVPGPDEWEVIVNAATEQWGIETAYTDEVRAQEIGRATVSAEQPEEHVETMTIRAVPAGDRESDLVLEWENSRIRIPIRATS